MRVFLVDGTYELFRHFYGVPPHRTAEGAEVAATRGVLWSMLRLLEQGVTHLGVATDHVIESFRNRLWPGYKSSAGLDPRLLGQFGLLEVALEAMGVVVWPMVELEADDALAGAAAVAADDPGVEQVVICTPDKDLGQCVRGTRVVQLDRRRRVVYDEAGVTAKFGVGPASIPDYLALVGDSADGYPGLPGWGARSAAAVLGLITASAVIVHLSGGVVEAHFHFFVMIGVITLYQDWLPFGLALGYVVVHHGLLGALRPTDVYNHPAALQHPWKWALIHGGFVLAASIAYLVNWRLSERQAVEISRLVSRLEGLARTDPLTGVPNRRVWEEELPRELERARRMGTGLCLAMIDLDNFKAYNDRFGHQAGDRVLKEAASAWRAQVRSTDLLVRYGGEEFALLLPACALEDAIKIIERLRAVTPQVTCSIGVACWDFQESAGELFERADQALYGAKAEGRNRYVAA